MGRGEDFNHGRHGWARNWVLGLREMGLVVRIQPGSWCYEILRGWMMKLLGRKVNRWWVIGVVGLLAVAGIVTAIKIQIDATEREWIQKLGIPHPVDATVVEEITYNPDGWFDGTVYYLRMDSRRKAQDACTQWAALFEKEGFDVFRSITKIHADDRYEFDGLPPSVKRPKRPPENDGWKIILRSTTQTACIFAWDSADGSTLELIYSSNFGP